MVFPPPFPQQIRPKSKSSALLPHITIGLQISQHRPELFVVLLFQVVKMREVEAAPVMAGAAQDMACHFMLVGVESNFQATGVMVQMSGSAGTGQTLGKAVLNQFWRNGGRVAPAGVTKR